MIVILRMRDTYIHRSHPMNVYFSIRANLRNWAVSNLIRLSQKDWNFEIPLLVALESLREWVINQKASQNIFPRIQSQEHHAHP